MLGLAVFAVFGDTRVDLDRKTGELISSEGIGLLRFGHTVYRRSVLLADPNSDERVWLWTTPYNLYVRDRDGSWLSEAIASVASIESVKLATEPSAEEVATVRSWLSKRIDAADREGIRKGARLAEDDWRAFVENLE